MNYSDVTLIPNFFDGTSRSEIDVSCQFLGRRFKLPVVPSNMSSVIDEKIAYELSQNGYFYIMHRFLKNGNIELVRRMNRENWSLKSISIGVKQEDKDFLKQCSEENLSIDFITIDVAHGHSLLVKNMIWLVGRYFPHIKIIAGNICTAKAAKDLISWGADCVKIGIAQGGACSTYAKTGFGMSMVESARNIFGESQDTFPIIIDGGIRKNGDIAKAIAIGYQAPVLPNGVDFKKKIPEVMVMAGSLFAACIDSPASMDKNGNKIYYGSASSRQKGHSKNVEGFEVEIACNNMKFYEKLEEIKQDLQSSCSYAGGCMENLINAKIIVN